MTTAHKLNFSKALEETNWEKLGPAANIKNFSSNMGQYLVNAAIGANVPKFKRNQGGREETTDQF